jgi:hypothetical protein
MKKLTVKLDDELNRVEIAMIKANIEGMAGVNSVLIQDAYCTCSNPSFAPFIECENCGNPPPIESAQHRVHADAGDSASFLNLFYPIFNLLNQVRRDPPQRR